MNGIFGVFDGVALISGTFDNDVDADEYRRDILQEGVPELFRTSLYDAHELTVRPVPDDYELWWRLLDGLRRSRDADRAKGRLVKLLEDASAAARV